MNVNTTKNSQYFTGLTIKGEGGLKYLAGCDVISLPKFRNKMDKLKNFDLLVTEEGPFICPKGVDAKFGPNYAVSDPLLPCGIDFNVRTNLQLGNNEPGPVELYLQYRTKQDALKAYRDIKEENDLWRAVNIVEKLDRDATKMLKQNKS